MNRSWTFASFAGVAMAMTACGGGATQLPSATTPPNGTMSTGGMPDGAGTGAPTADGTGTTPAASGTGTTAPSGVTSDGQIAQGKKVFGDQCASCHGPDGFGLQDNPAVIGMKKGALPLDPPKDAKRSVKFHTAADLFAYTKKAMPEDNAGSLSDADCLAVTAYLVQANGVGLAAPLDATNAASITLH